MHYRIQSLADMKIKLACVCLLCVAAPQLHAADTPLFRMASDAPSHGNGDPPAMVFQEVERSDTASTVELPHPQGSVAARSMFLLRGACALMKERGRQAFTVTPLSRQPVRFVLRFLTEESAVEPAPARPVSEGGPVSAANCNAMQSVFPK